MCRSVRQTPQAPTEISTCPTPGRGSGSSAGRKGSPARSRTIALIATQGELGTGDSAGAVTSSPDSGASSLSLRDFFRAFFPFGLRNLNRHAVPFRFERGGQGTSVAKVAFELKFVGRAVFVDPSSTISTGASSSVDSPSRNVTVITYSSPSQLSRHGWLDLRQSPALWPAPRRYPPEPRRAKRSPLAEPPRLLFRQRGPLRPPPIQARDPPETTAPRRPRPPGPALRRHCSAMEPRSAVWARAGVAARPLRRLDPRPRRHDDTRRHMSRRRSRQRLAAVNRHLDAQGNLVRGSRVVFPGPQAPEHAQRERHGQGGQPEDRQRREPSPQ